MNIGRMLSLPLHGFSPLKSGFISISSYGHGFFTYVDSHSTLEYILVCAYRSGIHSYLLRSFSKSTMAGPPGKVGLASGPTCQ